MLLVVAGVVLLCVGAVLFPTHAADRVHAAPDLSTPRRVAAQAGASTMPQGVTSTPTPSNQNASDEDDERAGSPWVEPFCCSLGLIAFVMLVIYALTGGRLSGYVPPPQGPRQ
jgi:hypothetical protein